MRVDQLLRLPTAMADLRPKLIAIAGRSFGPTGEPSGHVGIGFCFDDDIAGALQMVAINDDIAGKQHASPTI